MNGTRDVNGILENNAIRKAKSKRKYHRNNAIRNHNLT